MLLNFKKKILSNIKIIIKNFFFYNVALFDIVKIILSTRNFKEKNFFINTEGGFGPSITRSHLLNLNFKKNWILLFGTKKKRHNKNLPKIFENRLKFFRCGDLNRKENQIKFEKFVSKVLYFFFRINLHVMEDYIQNLEYNDKENELLDDVFFKKKKAMLFESCFFFKKRRNEIEYSENEYKKNFSKQFEKFGNNFRGRINFFLRGKGKKFKNDRFIDQIRDSRNIEDYKSTIESLVDKNWQVFLTGELFDIPNWIKNMDNCIIHREKTNLNLDDYNLFVLTNTDIYIGGSSSPPVFNCISNCKNLILETCHLGIAYLDTVVSYPKIKFNEFNELEEIFFRSPFDDQYLEDVFSKGKVERLSSKELQLITNEFIDNYENENFWKTTKSLGITRGQLFDLDAKISNTWLKLNNINL